MITAVVVDNGDALLKESLGSLRGQVDEIIVAPGPKTDLSLANDLADRLMNPVRGIGLARVRAIQEAKGKFVLSCDSDTVYHDGYAECAEQDLEIFRAVKAGRAYPYHWDPISAVESAIYPLLSYEFGLAFRKGEFLRAGIHELDYSFEKGDIGFHVLTRLLPFVDMRMSCSTRMPTYYGKLGIPNYLPSAIAGGVVVAGVALIPVANEVLKFFKK